MLGTVDTFGPQVIAAYVTPGGLRLMMMSDSTRPEETLRYFFSDVHGLYLKVPMLRRRLLFCGDVRTVCVRVCSLLSQLLLNPFYKPQSRIESTEFDERVRSMARKYLGFRD